MEYECMNCKWNGEELSKKPVVGKCPKCGDNVIIKGNIIEESNDTKKDNIISRIKEVTEDLLDDGKRNYSNNPKKKSPGRKSRSRK